MKGNFKIKIALGIEYNGNNYHGWQKQKKSKTIQERIEYSLSSIANENIEIFCAGRTDTGVHALGQVIHFNTFSNRNVKSWTVGVNSKLPSDISVRWIKKVPNLFHARFSATSRYYRYIIYNNKLRSSILKGLVTHVHDYLDEKKMHNASQLLLGENDFSSFRSSVCQSNSPWRNLIYINVQRYNNYIFIDLEANSFLHHMARNIVGSLIQIGKRKKNENWINEVLHLKNRNFAGMTAKPEGLYLITVFYPKFFKLPINLVKKNFLFNF